MNGVDMPMYPGRAALALLIGAALGAALVLLGLIVLEFGSGAPAKEYLPRALMMATLIFGVAFSIFVAGLIFLAAPLWWVLHQLGLRRSLYAVTLGVVLTFSASLALMVLPTLSSSGNTTYSSADGGGWIVLNNELTAHGWHIALESAALISIAGAIVGYAVWTIAYRWDAICSRHC